jgi:heme-degrading monooxygenase HmoA
LNRSESKGIKQENALSEIAKTPEPPYWAVIFTSLRTEGDAGYAETADRMVELAASMDGFLGAESARDGVGITVSYWRDPEAIRAWREHPEHRAAMARGRDRWYESFTTRVCKVERDNAFTAPDGK